MAVRRSSNRAARPREIWRSPTTTAASPTTTRATRPRHRRLRRGDPARSANCAWPTTTAASPTSTRATSTAPSPTTTRRSGSIRNIATAYNNRGIAYLATRATTTAPSPTTTRRSGSIPKYRLAYNNRGNAYGDKGDYDRAIADYNEAIRLDPKYASAYYNRGIAYDDKGDHDRAIADYDEAIRLDPKYAVAYNNRGNAYHDKGDYDRAIADYSEAIRLDPKYAHAYFNRGIAHLYADRLPNALADLIQSSELNPKYAYAALWLHIVDTRNNLPSQLAEAAKQIDMTKWPAPIIRFFLGQTTTQKLFTAADDADVKTKQRKTCEVNFYSAELALHRRAKDEATRLFRLAATETRGVAPQVPHRSGRDTLASSGSCHHAKAAAFH